MCLMHRKASLRHTTNLWEKVCLCVEEGAPGIGKGVSGLETATLPGVDRKDKHLLREKAPLLWLVRPALICGDRCTGGRAAPPLIVSGSAVAFLR